MAGRSLAFMDINNDGVGDLVVGAPGDSTGGMSSGKVMIYLGDVIESDPDIEIIGSAGERFGFAVARAGDVNSDGIDDLIVGAPSNDTGGIDAGTAYIIFGSDDVDDLPERAYDADVVIEGVDARGQLGYSVSTAGDANMDGYDDVLVGIPFTGAGKIHLLYGGLSMDGTPDKTFVGSTTGDQFGYSLAGGMNLDGSAQPDIVIGIPGSSSNKGAAQVILNPVRSTPKIVTLTGLNVGDRFGTSVTVTDYNGDIYGDVAVGAPVAASVGTVYLFYGSALAGKFDKVQDVTFSVGQAGDMFGLAIASGDPRTDDIGDLVVGAPMNDTAGIDAGRAYVFYGNATADAVPDVIVEGVDAESRFGMAVASGGNASANYNGDRAADFAVGAPFEGDSSEGAAYLYLGIRVVVPTNPTIYGYVLDAVDGTGLSDALVTMESSAYSRSVRTTANGSYGIASVISLPVGTYWVNASYDNYFTGTGQHALTLDSNTNVSFDLDRLPVVQGIIYDGNATGPLEGALVEVRDSSDVLLDSLTTDATGEYYFVLGVEDDISITVTKDYYFDGLIELTVACNDDIVEDLILDHYPILEFYAEDTDSVPIEGVDVSVSIDGELLATGETNADGETTIMVPGEGMAYVNSSRVGFVPESSMVDLVRNETDTLDIVMERQPSICGTVKDALFEGPVSGATVDLFDTGSTDILQTETSDSYGFYAFDIVEEGTYDLRVTASGYLRAYRLAVTVTADEMATEDFWLMADTVPPTSVISDPQPGLIFLTPEISVFANATDPNGNDIASVALYYSHEGKPYRQWGSSDTVAPYMFVFNASAAYGDGVYEFYTIAWDCAGNRQVTPTTNDTWIIMNSGVPVSEVDPLDEYQSTETFTVTATGTDAFGVQYIELWYSFDGGAYELYDDDDVAPYSWEFTAADGDGEYSFYSILVNEIGQTELPPEDADTYTILDTTAPEALITSPGDGDVLNTGSVGLVAEIADAGAGLDYVSYEVDSDDEVVVEVEDGLASYDLSVTLALDDGEHTIMVTATDMLGWQYSDDVTFSVDTSDPVVTILDPVDGSAVNTPDVEVTWFVEDETTGVVLTEIRMLPGAWETVTGTSMLYEDLDDDIYTVEVRVTDGADNTDTASTTFEVDTIAPTVYITTPEDGALLTTTSVLVKWEQSDIGSGIDTVEVRIDGGDWVLAETNSTTFTSVSEGAHTVDVMATDEAGNDDMDSVSFEVDGTAPVVTITSPEDGEVFGTSSVTAEWTVTDGGTGILSVEYKLDSAAWVTTTPTGSVTLEGLAEGSHTFSVKAVDNAGNDVTVPVEFVIDTVDPTVEITSPADGAVVGTEDVTVTYTTDGTGSDIVTIERRVDGGSWASAGATSTVVSSLNEGAHTVEIRVTDEAGHQATASVDFTVDLGAPVVTITSPTDGVLLNTDSVTVEWTVSDPAATVEVKLDDGSWLSATGGSETFTGLADGEHTVYVRATDDASNEGSDDVTFTVDATPPTVSITAPASDAILGSSTVVVSWTATDADATAYRVDGGLWQAVTGTSVTISSLADGEHTVEVQVTDEAGNDASDSVSFTVDTVAPTVEITSPSADATVGADVTVEWTASDGSGSGVDTVDVRIDEGDWEVATGASYEFTALASGEHTVEVRATDLAGNSATVSVTFTVSADTTDPIVSITSPADGAYLAYEDVTVAFTASDSGSGVSTIEAQLDSGAWVVVTGVSRTFAGLADGSHTVTIRVTDNAGNVATDEVTFTVDTVDPTLSITSPEDAWSTEDSSVTVAWTCTDVGCGIDHIEISLDGGAYLSVGTASERTFDALAAGEHTVIVRAYDNAGNMVTASVSFTVSEGGGISGYVIVGIVLVVVVVAAAAVMMMRRKKSSSPPPPQE